MDLFLRGVPHDMRGENLMKELQQFMNVLGILDWTCHKPQGKSFAFLSFLEVSDAEKFFAKHSPEQRKNPGGSDIWMLPHLSARPSGLGERPRLRILSKNVFVSRSTNPADTALISHLKLEKEKRIRRKDKTPGASPKEARLISTACGKMEFLEDDELVFAAETVWTTTGSAKFGRHNLVMSSDEDPHARLTFPYHIMEDIIVSQQFSTMLLILNQPPEIHRRLSQGIENSMTWERSTCVARWPRHDQCVEHCLVYQLSFTHGLDTLSRGLESRELAPVSYANLRTRVVVQDHGSSYIQSFQLLRRTFDSSVLSQVLPYVIRFQVERLVWDNYLHPAAALQLLLAMSDRTVKSRKTKHRTLLTTDSIKRCFTQIPYPYVGMSPSEFDPLELLATFITSEKEAFQADPTRSGYFGAHLPPGKVWVLRADVTPTRITLAGPDPEPANKVLRRFQDYSTFFMRVTFSDENGQDISYHPKISNERIYQRYRQVLSQGITVAGRTFEFLGFSHSSLRSHSTWLIAPFVDGDGHLQNRSTILASLGDFDNIRIAAKCAARIGQAFSDTPFAVDINEENIAISWIQDVKTADGQFFSDGVGTISLDAARLIWSRHAALTAATCFQIRWAGCKGMLTLDSRLEGKRICIRRESMMKFPSQDMDELGICDAATRPLRLYLNGQLIKILEDMGTSPTWFERVQDQAIRMLKDVTANAWNTSTFLKHQHVGSGIGFPRFIRSLEKLKIDYRRDRFLKNVVENVVLRELRLLKHKARIPIDKGVTLFGVMDETGFLQEGEVCFTFEETSDQRKKSAYEPPVAGSKILVTRSPALHPGDIQLATFVRPPSGHSLTHLRNCVIFSQRGSRGLPSQLSGGDLDGDKYNIIWDAGALPKNCLQPAEYPRVTPPQLDHAVTKDDIVNFFIDFMRTDILGLIANRHLIIADVRDEGALHHDCLSLASLHSTAVDYSKTGIPVPLSTLPRAPRTKPDFLAPAPPLKVYDLGQVDHIVDDDDEEEDEDEAMRPMRPKYHESQKILGKLYRAIDERKIWDKHIHRHITTSGPSVWEQLAGRAIAELEALGVEANCEHLHEAARRVQRTFGDAIDNLRWQFSEKYRSPLSDVEAFCGAILNKTGMPTKRQRDRSMKLKEEADRVMNETASLIRKAEGHGVGFELDEGLPGPITVRLSLACLAIRPVGSIEKQHPEKHHQGSEELYASFRTIAGCCLLQELETIRGLQI